MVSQLNNNLNSRPQWITDSSGKITGYKTKAGADTVFPFKGSNFIKMKASVTADDLVYHTGGSTVTVTGFSKIIVNEVSLNVYNGGQTVHESYIRLTANGSEVFRIGNYTGSSKITPGTEYSIPSSECVLNCSIACYKNKGVFDIKIVP